MTKKLLAITIAFVPLFAQSAPKITFQGEVNAQTCIAEVNGQTNGVVLLPTASTKSLQAAGSVTGTTPFTISVRECEAKVTIAHINTEFLGHGVTPAGNLGNLATSNAATKVQLQLLDKYPGGSAIRLSGTTAVPGLVLVPGKTAASHEFGVQYISEEGLATAGAVLSVAEYAISYN